MTITIAQIKKIHALVNSLRLKEEYYKAILFRYGAETSKELSKSEAIKFINELMAMQKEQQLKSMNKGVTGVHSEGRLVYFNRKSKATDNQIEYIAGLWLNISENKDYRSLMWFIKRITKKLYIHIESITLQEASKIIVALEKWNKQKEINL